MINQAIANVINTLAHPVTLAFLAVTILVGLGVLPVIWMATAVALLAPGISLPALSLGTKTVSETTTPPAPPA